MIDIGIIRLYWPSALNIGESVTVNYRLLVVDVCTLIYYQSKAIERLSVSKW